VDAKRARSFGSVAEEYDRWRPSYPAALVEDVLAAAAPVARSPLRLLDVGAGTGKATVRFAQRGAEVTALEPDPDMAAIVRQHCASLTNVHVEQTTLEECTITPGAFDVVTSAQAWHWMTPDVRTRMARSALCDGGVLALFWNMPDWTRSELASELRDAYEATVPDFGPDPGPMHPGHEGDPSLWGDYISELDAEHGFAVEPVRRYSWTAAYRRDEYVSLIGTHSDHILLSPDERQRLLAAVSAVIDGAGGRFVLSYTTVLWLALARAVTV
jgi:SAM-dependent methyltransferase